MRTRPARDDDADDLIGLIAACWAAYPGCVLDVHGEMPHLLAVASHYEGLGGRVWVVEDPGRVVASVALVPSTAGDPTGRGVELRMLYVDRRWRRRGLGADLVALVEDHARGHGAPFVDLWSDTRFTDAHRLYERLGYRRLPETRELNDLSSTIEFHYCKTL